MGSFKDLISSSPNNIKSLSEKLAQANTQKSYEDDRFWSLQRDQAGNGFAVIRFLPESEGETSPFVKIYSHGFQGPGGWYIENCPTTLGLECPVCKRNGELWNSGLESNKTIARERKRKLTYVSNILVIKDPKNKENEGKVFLFKYGKSIFDKITECITPREGSGEEAVNPFHLLEGANFKLKVKMVANYPNYTDSVFEAPTQLLNGDVSKLEKIWNSQYKLQELIAGDKFKSYEELEQRLVKVTAERKTAEPVKDFSSVIQKQSVKQESSKPPFNTSSDGDEDAEELFKKIMAED